MLIKILFMESIMIFSKKLLLVALKIIALNYFIGILEN